jgi:nitrile hydratase accessory protein
VTGPSTARDDAFSEETLPRSNGELIFDHPWQARALAMAVLLVERTGRPWDDFRRRLMNAIGDRPERPYWESWVVALESLAADSQGRGARLSN